MAFQINFIRFLFPLEQVRRIVSAREAKDGRVMFDGRTVAVIDLGRLSGCVAADRPHVVLLEYEDGIVGIGGGLACGVIRISPDRFRRIPEEVSDPGRRILKGAAYLDEEAAWAWRVDVQALAGTEERKLTEGPEEDGA